jgi:hypothetical protein
MAGGEAGTGRDDNATQHLATGFLAFTGKIKLGARVSEFDKYLS